VPLEPVLWLTRWALITSPSTCPRPSVPAWTPAGRAFGDPDPDKGLRQARELARVLDPRAPGAAASLRERLKEIFVLRSAPTGVPAPTLSAGVPRRALHAPSGPWSQPARVGGVFGRWVDVQYSQGLASGSMARSMSFTDHSRRPSAVMWGRPAPPLR
jgi:hypothetical protein